MPLAVGTRLGPYEILAALGAGGMGEVYRARDPRLGREVALKVLPSEVTGNEDRLLRFEQEARAAGGLNHPNIVAIYDVGHQDGVAYVVAELVEGGTLRQRLAEGPLPLRRALELSAQVAHGLAAAHARGIVHRDLKPENIALTGDGRAKVLDFGLAKLGAPLPSGATESLNERPTAELAPHSDPGRVVGTVGYMSPEQVRGQAVDHRSDIFSLGAILYEMLSGRRAFRGDSAADTITAVLKDEPADLSATGVVLPPAAEQVVRHCLEKRPDERYQSARDLAFHLQALAAGGSAVGRIATPARRRRRTRALLAAALALMALAGAFAVGRWAGRPQPGRFHQLTFRRGAITTARFAPDGDTIVYGAAFDGAPFQLYSTRATGPESRPLGLPEGNLMALSRQGELAVGLHYRFRGGHQFSGTLSRAPLSGGAPREMLEDVYEADWLPDGSDLVVIRSQDGRDRLEWPVGTTRYETAGWVSHARTSPRGSAVAFIDHPQYPDDGGSLVLLDARGARVLSAGWHSARGLAWTADGGRILMTASRAGRGRSLWSVDLSGQARLLAVAPGPLTLQDVARDGRLLITRESARYEIAALAPGETRERDLSWLDGSMAEDLSDDGRTLLFYEGGEAGGSRSGVYVRGTDGSPAVRLGDGFAGELSPDKKWALAIQRPTRLVLLPTGPGQPRDISPAGITDILWALWVPGGEAVIVNGAQEGRPVRSWWQDLRGGAARPITPEGLWARLASPDGRQVAAVGAGRRPSIVDLGTEEAREVRGARPGDRPIRWSADGRVLDVFRRDEMPCRIYRVDLVTGARVAWREVRPADTAGVVAVHEMQMTADGRFYSYSYVRLSSELYLLDGVEY
jgi:tRNA A-37 threonylcarbamoyl transferase component Bud32